MSPFYTQNAGLRQWAVADGYASGVQPEAR